MCSTMRRWPHSRSWTTCRSKCQRRWPDRRLTDQARAGSSEPDCQELFRGFVRRGPEPPSQSCCPCHPNSIAPKWVCPRRIGETHRILRCRRVQVTRFSRAKSTHASRPKGGARRGRRQHRRAKEKAAIAFNRGTRPSWPHSARRGRPGGKQQPVPERASRCRAPCGRDLPPNHDARCVRRPAR